MPVRSQRRVCPTHVFCRGVYMACYSEPEPSFRGSLRGKRVDPDALRVPRGGRDGGLEGGMNNPTIPLPLEARGIPFPNMTSCLNITSCSEPELSFRGFLRGQRVDPDVLRVSRGGRDG